MRDTQHSPASPGDKLKKGQMAQGQESSVKRKRARPDSLSGMHRAAHCICRRETKTPDFVTVTG